ncbi:MAG: MarR family transcriptional regulator [Azospirillaceae bacterium]|nr:MarR family transcriptional regulator [Azospirillaceae bacterium]
MDDQQPTRTLGFVLHDVARLMRRDLEQRGRLANLTMTRAQWSVLAHLARNQGINQSALAQILDIEPITLVRLLDKLEAAHLIERRPAPGDRRCRRLFLTDQATPFLEQIHALAVQTRARALHGLSPAQREQLMELLLVMRSNLSNQNCDPAPDHLPDKLPDNLPDNLEDPAHG